MKIFHLKQTCKNKKRNAAETYNFEPGFADNFIFKKILDVQDISASLSGLFAYRITLSRNSVIGYKPH